MLCSLELKVAAFPVTVINKKAFVRVPWSRALWSDCYVHHLPWDSRAGHAGIIPRCESETEPPGSRSAVGSDWVCLAPGAAPPPCLLPLLPERGGGGPCRDLSPAAESLAAAAAAAWGLSSRPSSLDSD